MNILTVLCDKGGGFKDDAENSFSSFTTSSGKQNYSKNLLSNEHSAMTSYPEEGQLLDFDDDIAVKQPSMDATLFSTALEMLDAIEIAIWDAALDK